MVHVCIVCLCKENVGTAALNGISPAGIICCSDCTVTKLL